MDTLCGVISSHCTNSYSKKKRLLPFFCDINILPLAKAYETMCRPTSTPATVSLKFRVARTCEKTRAKRPVRSLLQAMNIHVRRRSGRERLRHYPSRNFHIHHEKKVPAYRSIMLNASRSHNKTALINLLPKDSYQIMRSQGQPPKY